MLGRSLGRWGVCNFPSGRFHIGGLQQRSMAGSRRRVRLKRSQQAATLGAEKACKKGWVSSRRRNQLRSDRRLTKAISLFLQEQRARLEAQLTPSRRVDRITKRNELMRLARVAFRALPGDEQNKYLHSSAGSSGVGVSSSAPLAAIATPDSQPSAVASSPNSDPDIGSEKVEEVGPAQGNRQAGAMRSWDAMALADSLAKAKVDFWKGIEKLGCSEGATAPSSPDLGFEQSLADMLGMDALAPSRACQESNKPMARFPIRDKRPDVGVYGPGKAALPSPGGMQTPSPNSTRVRQYGSLGVGSGSQKQIAEPSKKAAAVKSALRDSLIDKASQPLRESYGDAGCMEVLAASFRILDVGESGLMSLRGSLAVKLAALLGVAAKLTQASDDRQHIVKLWASIAGEASEQHVRNMETKVISLWVKPCLGSDACLHTLHQ